MMDYDASITYRNPVPANAERAEQATERGPLPRPAVPGVRAHLHRRRGLLPDRRGRAHRGARGRPARRRGVVTNYTIITPVQYPGQTETEPFARVHVWLDGTDVVLGYQALIDVPERRHAHRHAGRGDVGVGGREGRPRVHAARARLVGWIPTGEPDDDDPDLVNRIC